MNPTTVNADFAQRVVIVTDDLPWLASPEPGVERRMLDRIGGEVARATSLVRYAPRSRFAEHAHALGEEFLVLDGTFSDEHGDYPKGTYVRNPPGSRHSPRSDDGCVILVKLRQMPERERRHVVVDTEAAPWESDSAVHGRLDLFQAEDGERVAMERLLPGATLAAMECEGGEEIFVLSGDLADEHGRYPRHSWIRNPDGFRRSLRSDGGAVFWVKRGHLPARVGAAGA